MMCCMRGLRSGSSINSRVCSIYDSSVRGLDR